MKRKILISILFAVAIFGYGCTNAGPYVTDISFDDEGNMLVTKNTVVHKWIFGIFDVIHVGNEPKISIIKMPKYSNIKGYQATTDPKTGKIVTWPVYEKKKK